jgi:hypothetical protein
MLQKVWEWANGKLTTEEIKNNLLLATGIWGIAVFHAAAKGGELGVLQRVWEWPNKKITTEETNNELLLATDAMGRTFLHMATIQGILVILQKVWMGLNRLKQQRRYIIKYYQKQKVINDCLARGIRVL